jgi:hypothetical protein
MPSPSPADPYVGRTIGGSWRIEAPLGEGGGGRVYRARDLRLDRQVALKLIEGEGADEEALERFTREAKAAAQVADPHVAQIYQLGREDGIHYIIQELVEGESLHDRLEREGRLDPAEVLAIGSGIAQGLVAVHRARLVHRDLKPGNVMITPSGTPRIIDFGLVLFMDDDARLTRRGMLLGTPLYMAPEQIGLRTDAPVAQLDRADVFSLGCILYRALTGRAPHDTGDKDLKEFLRRRSREPADLSALGEGVPASLAGLLEQMLERVPARRPDVKEVRRVLLAARKGLRTKRVARPREVPETTPSRARAGVTPRQLAALAVATVVVSGSLGIVLLGPRAQGAGSGSATTTSRGAGSRTPEAPTPAAVDSAARDRPSGERPQRGPPSTSPGRADALERALGALRALRWEEAERLLGTASTTPQEEVEAARRLAAVLRDLNGDPSLSRECGVFVPFRAESAPRTSRLVADLEPGLSTYGYARYAAEHHDRSSLVKAFRRYELLDATGSLSGEPAPFLLEERRGEFELLRTLARLAGLAGRRRDPRALAGLERLLASPPVRTGLYDRLEPWLRVWGTHLRLRIRRREQIGGR